MLPEWHKILLIKLRAIGDVILTTPVIQNFRQQYPTAQIDFVIEKSALPILKSNPDLDHVFVATSGNDRSIARDWRLLRMLQRQKYDVAIDLFGNPRSAWLTLLSGAALRVGFDFRGRKYAYHVRIPSRANQVHEVDFNLDALRYFSIPVANPQPYLAIDNADIVLAKAIFADLNFHDAAVVALNPAGSWPAKRWPLDYFAKLADLLQNQFPVRFLVLWGPGEMKYAESLALIIGKLAQVHPPTTLSEQAALLSLCRLFVGNDSGPMHLAAAIGIPTIGLYGPTNTRLQSPFGRYAKAVYRPEIPCLGCNRLVCPLMDCMNYLQPTDVLTTIIQFVDAGQALLN